MGLFLTQQVCEGGLAASDLDGPTQCVLLHGTKLYKLFCVAVNNFICADDAKNFVYVFKAMNAERRISGERVKERRETLGLSQAELGARVGTKQQNIGQLEAGEVAWPKYASDLPTVLECSLDYLMGRTNNLKDRIPSKDEALLPVGHPVDTTRSVVAVYASAQAGPYGEAVNMDHPVEYRAPSPALNGVTGAYGMYVVADSMEPKYRKGDVLWVHPAKPVRPGDYVVIVMQDNLAIVKRFVRRTKTHLIVRQLNPEDEYHIPLKSVLTVHKVVGNDEA